MRTRLGTARPSADAAPSSSPRGEEPRAPASQRDKINQAEGTATWGLPHNHAETHGWARTGTAFVEPTGWGDVPPGHRLELDTCTPGVGVLLPLGQRGGDPGQKVIVCVGTRGTYPGMRWPYMSRPASGKLLAPGATGTSQHLLRGWQRLGDENKHREGRCFQKGPAVGCAPLSIQQEKLCSTPRSSCRPEEPMSGAVPQ